jgi:hypothetical protein
MYLTNSLTGNSKLIDDNDTSTRYMHWLQQNMKQRHLSSLTTSCCNRMRSLGFNVLYWHPKINWQYAQQMQYNWFSTCKSLACSIYWFGLNMNIHHAPFLSNL